MNKVEDGTAMSILSKASNFLTTSLHKHRQKQVMANLDGLSTPQLKLVLRLMEQMHKVNKEYEKANISNNN
jgi:hypothetical protein